MLLVRYAPTRRSPGLPRPLAEARRRTMRPLRNSLSWLLLVPTLCACQGAVWGNMAALLVTVVIFVGTLALGRPPT